MRSRIEWLSSAFVLAGLILTFSAPWAQAGEGGKEPFVIVELFTSQGCSSCPPADHLLRQLAFRNKKGNTRIFPLGFHVDYWDHLGWKDPFSRREYTKRQYRYAQSLGSKNVYTPQMIINGHHAFSGFRDDLLQRNISQALDETPKVRLQLTNHDDSGDSLKLSYAVEPLPKQTVLNLAVIEDERSTRVARGENAGKTLINANIVRAFDSIPLVKPRGIVRVRKPMGAEVSAIVGFVQNLDDMHILGAERVSIAP